MKLKNRLAAVADFIVGANCLADIGTDHAYLPVYLVKQGIINKAIACDINKGPCQAAKRTIDGAGLSAKIVVRLGDGLHPLQEGEADVVAIAGMGGTTMIDILTGTPNVTAGLAAVVLQPMNSSSHLRKWLVNNEWQIIDETLVEEDGRLYEIIYAKPGKMIIAEEMLYEIGPCLWNKRHPLLKEHMSALLRTVERIMQAMAINMMAKQSEKYRKLAAKADRLKEMIKCL